MFDSAREHLTPLGYLLVSSQVPRVPGTERPYYGVDRLPPICSAYPPIREALGEPLEEDPVVAAGIEEWFDLEEDAHPTRITPDYEKACRLVRILGQRYALEMLFCELAWSPGEEGQVRRFRQFVGEPRGVGLFYGYDVASINCNESAIMLLGHIPRMIRPEWKDRVNQWGLLENYEDARQLREEATDEVNRPEDVYYIFRVYRAEVSSD